MEEERRETWPVGGCRFGLLWFPYRRPSFLAVMADLCIIACAGLVTLYSSGDRKRVEAKLFKEVRLRATTTGPDGHELEGTHAGERILGGPRRSLKSFGMPRYTVIAEGPGSFISANVKYEGDFLQGKFHDLTGTAKLDILDSGTGQFQKYIGSFVDGQRSGPGELQLYDGELNTFYTHFRGTWANDRPYKGSYYTPEGIVSARIDDQFQKYIGSFVDGQRSGPGELQLYDDELNTFYTHFRGTWANNRPYKGSYYTPEGIVSARIDEENCPLANHRSGTKPVLPTTGSCQGRAVEVDNKVEARHRAGTSAVTPEAFHDHCEKGRAAEVAAALEAARGDPERLGALLDTIALSV